VFEDAAVTDIDLPAFEFEPPAQQQFGIFQLARGGIIRVKEKMFGNGAVADELAIDDVAAKDFAKGLSPPI
jgi:hypothetical protein